MKALLKFMDALPVVAFTLGTVSAVTSENWLVLTWIFIAAAWYVGYQLEVHKPKTSTVTYEITVEGSAHLDEREFANRVVSAMRQIQDKR